MAGVTISRLTVKDIESDNIYNKDELVTPIISATFSSIGLIASIQWMVKPRRSIPRNQVI